MAAQPRVVLLTSTERRHCFVARTLHAGLDLVAVVCEAKRPVVAAPDALAPADAEVIAQHFAERDHAEVRLLGEDTAFPPVACREIPAGAVNDPALLAWLVALAPDFVVLYGSGLVRAPLLQAFTDRVVNLHLGLSPYYRGSGTNFWPLANRQPECVGATLHLAVEAVDAGGILAQVRPAPEAADRAHEFGTKTIMAAARLLPAVVRAYAAGQLRPQPQPAGVGQVFRNRDFNAAAVRRMWAHFDSGMVPEYLAHQAERQAAFPIVSGP